MPPSNLETWRRVADDEALLRRAADCDPTDVASVARLRKHASPDEAAVALELIKARRKAAAKFPDHATRLIADATGVEQATSFVAARHKAERFRDAGLTRVTDLCCGVGGDALGLVAAGLDVTAVDLDPVRAWMAGQNAGCATRVADAEGLIAEAPHHASRENREGGSQSPGALHLDPARRTDAGRVFRLADYQPSPTTIRRLLEHFGDTGVKLSPAINLDELEDTFSVGDAEVEFISEAGRLVQAVLWTGRLARPDTPRSATLLVDNQTHRLTGPPGETEFAPAGRYLFTVDPAVERAGLMAELGLPAVHPRLGLLTSDDLNAASSPWLTGFELLAELPWHAHDPRKVRGWLADHDGGIIEVKTRGKAVDPDHAQKLLRGPGNTPYTVFVLRFDQRLAALITRRLENTC
ncbi:MAG: hypothetical protein AAF333_02585 [Planctomycetota bacterium]